LKSRIWIFVLCLVMDACGTSNSVVPESGLRPAFSSDHQLLSVLAIESRKSSVSALPLSLSHVSNAIGVMIPNDLARRAFPELASRATRSTRSQQNGTGVYRFLTVVRSPSRKASSVTASAAHRSTNMLVETCTLTVYGIDWGDGTWSYVDSSVDCYTYDDGSTPIDPSTGVGGSGDCNSDPSLCEAAQKNSDFNLSQETACINAGGRFLSIAKNQGSRDAGIVTCVDQPGNPYISLGDGNCNYIVKIYNDTGYELSPIPGTGVLTQSNSNARGLRFANDCSPRFSNSGYY